MTLDLDDPIALMLAAVRALERAQLPAAAYGGLAVGMYGEPRETRDADLAVAAVSAEQARVALEAIGVTTLVAFSGVRFGGNTVSRVSLVGGGQLNTVDLVQPLSRRYADAVLARAVEGSLRGETLRAVSPEDLVLLKVLSTRERDLEDARSVIAKLGARLDRELLDREVALLAIEIADHDVRGRYATITR